MLFVGSHYTASKEVRLWGKRNVLILVQLSILIIKQKQGMDTGNLFIIVDR